MSAKSSRRLRLKRKDSLVESALAYAAEESGFADEIDVTAEQLHKLLLETAECPEREPLIWIKIGEDVDVGLVRGLVAGDGAEQAQVEDAAGTQFGFMSAEDGEGLVSSHAPSLERWAARRRESLSGQAFFRITPVKSGIRLWGGPC